MQFFDFEYLIDKYKSEFTVIIPASGEYDDKGDYVKGEETRITLQGAIIGHRESKIYRSEGVLTAKDKRLFVSEPIENALIGAKAVYEGELFNIEDNTENAKFTGVYAYTLKYVSAFKEG